MRQARLRLTYLTAALCAAVVVLAAVASAGRPADALLLPDLVQRPPTELQVSKAPDGSIRLGFGSAVVNRGAGPLIIRASRTSQSQTAMTATQLVRREDGRSIKRPHVGVVQYTRDPTHQHWHLLRFDRYTLRRPGQRTPLVADRKSGFCLGDRFEESLVDQLPGEPAQPPYERNCGMRLPRLLQLTAGISVGYGDDYSPYLEGQWLPLDGLPAGRYELVHHANADGRLLEERYDNNTACRKLELTWPDGRSEVPGMRTFGRC